MYVYQLYFKFVIDILFLSRHNCVNQILIVVQHNENVYCETSLVVFNDRYLLLYAYPQPTVMVLLMRPFDTLDTMVCHMNASG